MLKVTFSQPPDEVKAFATKASRSAATAPKGIPGLPPSAVSKTDKPVSQPKSNAKKSQEQGTKLESVTNDLANSRLSATTGGVPSAAESASAAASATVQVDPAKRLKALRKKLRDINEMADKNLVDLTPEQVEKLSKKNEIENEIASLS